MKHEEFAGILEKQLARVSAILGVKTEEYATEDQLHNIRMSAILQGCSLPEAVAGMMVKHTVSIFTMVKDGKPHPEAKWDEKITDHIVWLILLKAALIEGAQNPIGVDIPTALRARMGKNRNAFVDVNDILVQDGDRMQLSGAEILRFAAMMLEHDPPNPDQGTLSC
jgi:hypothetical protein